MLCAPARDSSREDRGRSPQRDFHILFVPRRSLLCEQWLKEQGVLGSFIHREQYSLDLIPFDGDLLSMESESAFKVRSGAGQFRVGCGRLVRGARRRDPAGRDRR